MRALFVSLFVALVAPASACGSASPASGLNVKTSGAEISTLGRYHTYMHTTAKNPPEGYAFGALRPAVLDKVQRDIDAQLQAKGYQLAENGELAVRISTGGRTIEEQPTGSAAMAGAPEKEVTEGALVIDIFERATDKQLFHGIARGVIQKGDVKDELIYQAVTKVLDPVPVSTAR